MFEQWARLQQTADVVPEEWNLQAGLAQALEQQSSVDDRALQNIYAVMGSTQSLLDAMQEFNDNFRQINWNQWAVARF